MDLHDYLRVLRRNWLVILAVTLVGLLAGAASALLVKPTYTANTQLFVAIQSSGTVSELQQGNTFTQSRVQSYVKTVSTPVVLQPVIDSLGLEVTPGQLAGNVRATTDQNTVLVNIAVSDNSPVRAAAIAQATAKSLVVAIDTLEQPKQGGVSPVRLTIVAPAEAPSSPSAPNTKLNLAAGLGLGLFAGIAIAFLRTVLDTRIRSEADVRRVTDSPLLGAIAFDADASRRPLLTQVGQQSPRSESFRQLRTNLQFANISGQARTILVTSSLPGEGKSTTATNLAISLAQAGHAVCLIDADLRRPMVNEYLRLDRNAGLTTLLVGAADPDDLLQRWGDDELYVLTSGQIPPNPSELLGSDEMRKILERLSISFDTIVIDAPPLLPVTDAAVLSQFASGVILVAGSQKVRQPEFERSLSTLQMVGAHLLGIVLNRVPMKGPDAYAYSYGYPSESDGGEKVMNAVSNDRDGLVPRLMPDFIERLPSGSTAREWPKRD